MPLLLQATRRSDANSRLALGWVLLLQGKK
eukprot:COSAG04_NODE_32112_length_253_cov_0.655844_1_plen_29_part_01